MEDCHIHERESDGRHIILEHLKLLQALHQRAEERAAITMSSMSIKSQSMKQKLNDMPQW